MTMPADGGATPGSTSGQGHSDGPEYSPDGEWLYLNTEAFTPNQATRRSPASALAAAEANA